MTLNLTKGGLSPAKIINLATNEEVKFMFNPFEYGITKDNSWERKPVIGENIPMIVFQHGGAQKLSLQLHFDTLAEDIDVRQHTDTLWKMMMVNTAEENARSGKSAPPPVAFQWGRMYFKSIITNMNQKFTLFKADGTPLRCTIDITLEQVADDTTFQPQPTGGSDSSSTASASGNRPSSATVIEGDRMDHIAANSTGDASNYRQVAEANNIDNPMSIRPGQTLTT